MDWIIKHEPKQLDFPWFVYGQWGKREVFEACFASEEEARDWVATAREHPDKHLRPVTKIDEVNQASEMSFPASDPPAWNETTAR